MKTVFTHVPNRYLFVAWTTILTIGLVLALYGIQANAEQDASRSAQIQAEQASQKAEVLANQAVVICHAISDNNQAIRDISSLLSVETKITPDMTPSQMESIRIANERRKGYRIIYEDLFPVPQCDDGYKPVSRQDKLLPFLQVTPGTTTTTTVGG